VGDAIGVHEGTIGVTDRCGVKTSVCWLTSASEVDGAVSDGVIGIGVKTGMILVGTGVQVYSLKVAVTTGTVFVAVGVKVIAGVA
jgi:hypothetical protein